MSKSSAHWSIADLQKSLAPFKNSSKYNAAMREGPLSGHEFGDIDQEPGRHKASQTPAAGSWRLASDHAQTEQYSRT
jgi:hypothetical protein